AVDRNQAARLGFTETDVTRSLFIALMSSAQIAPNFWIDRQSGNHYFVGVQYPEHLVESIQTLEQIPVSAERGKPGAGVVRQLKEVARVERTQGPVEVFRYNADRISQLFINVAGNDLARIAEQVEQL